MQIKLPAYEWKFPLLGEQINNIYLIKIHKISSSSNAKGDLIDPHLTNPCNNKEWCDLDEYTKIFGIENSLKRPCKTLLLLETKGISMFNNLSESNTPTLVSKSNNVEFSFPTFDKLEIACVEGDNPIYYSNEGVMVMFTTRGEISELYYCYREENLLVYRTWVKLVNRNNQIISRNNKKDLSLIILILFL